MKKIILIASAVLLGLALVLGGVLFFMTRPEPVPQPVVYTFPEMTTDLLNGMIKFTVTIKLDSQEAADLLELPENKAAARDAILSIVRSTRREEARGGDGMEKLGAAIKAALGRKLTMNDQILSVWFESFVIQ